MENPQQIEKQSNIIDISHFQGKAPERSPTVEMNSVLNMIQEQQKTINILLEQQKLFMTLNQGQPMAVTAPPSPPPEEPVVTFSECAEFYLENNKSMKDSSRAGVYWKLEKHILPKWGNTDVKDITSRTMQEWANYLLEKFSIKTAKDSVRIMKTILTFCGDYEMIEHKIIRCKFPKEDDEEYQVPTNAEIKKIREACIAETSKYKKPNYLGLLIATYTGCRIGEVCGLQWKDINFKNNTIQINKTVNRIYDCREKTSRINISSPKTATSKRTIPLNKELRKILIAERQGPEIFIASGKDYPQEPRTHRQFYGRLLKRLGIKNYTYHAIRHYFATHACELGIDPKTTAAILGHKNCDITLNVYTNVSKNSMKSAVNKF